MSQYLPPGSGKTLVIEQCATCHDLAGVVHLRASKAAWEAIVIDMVARGAPLLVEEVDAITAYLAEALGPTAPPLVDVNSASRDELVKLPGVTPAMADRLIDHREQTKPFSSRDEVQSVLGLDDAAFGKLKWFLRAVQAS